MATGQLSPRKYIETKARTLPVYKCLISKNWQETSGANVIVMRRHVNGHLTAGVYLVDLLCLGVKDTFFFFNEPEEDIYDRFPDGMEEVFEEADYNLAHNIVYAGYEFAIQFGIEPAADFAITRFILEEDTDAVPIIDIAVGDDEGLPHLMVDHPGEYSSALAKLVKNAGDGNFHYTISSLTNDNEYDEDEEASGSRIDDYEPGELSPVAARFLEETELSDAQKIAELTHREQLTVKTEQALRNLRTQKPAFFGIDIEDSEEYEWIDNSKAIACGITEEEEDEYLETAGLALEQEDMAGSEEEEYCGQLLAQNGSNLLIVSSIFEKACIAGGALLPLAKAKLEDLQVYPLAKLDLALANLLQPVPAPGFEDIYAQEDITQLYKTQPPGDRDLAAFWLTRLLFHLRQNDLTQAVKYYYLYSDVNTTNYMITAIQQLLLEAIDHAVQHSQ